MKAAKYIVIIIGIGIIGFVLYALLTPFENEADIYSSLGQSESQDLPMQIFESLDGEQVSVIFSTETAIIINHEDDSSISLNRAVSGSGARYVNKDESIVLWNKGDDITLYKNDEVTFEGSLLASKPSEDSETILPEINNEEFSSKNNLVGTWVWTKTVLNSNQKENIQPKSNEFTLRFTDDMRVSGTTDCNNFMGSYTKNGKELIFGALASTLMYCENSQENEFHDLLSNSSSYMISPDGSLVLILANNSGTLIFSPANNAEENEVTFMGTLEEVNTGCFVDAECYIIVDGKHVTAIRGWSQDIVGTIIGVDGFGDLESKKGEQIEVYARFLDDKNYTLYGSSDYYIKTL